MKRYENSYYTTASMHGPSPRLVGGFDTIEEVREEIDRSNARALERGYKAEPWLITFVEVYTYYTDDGVFVKREETEEALEAYPAKI